MKLYKVLRRDGRLFGPFQKYEYEAGREYICEDFDSNPSNECSRGYYATGIDGIIYSFRNLPGYEVWEVEVGGRGVEIDRFKRRYERIKLVRQVPLEEVRALAEAEEENVGYKLSEALFPVNPLKIEAGPVTDEEIELLKKWRSVRRSIRHSVWDSVWDSVWGNVWGSIRDSVWDNVWGSIRDSVWGSIRSSVWDSVGAYISSFYPGIKTWKYIDHPEGENPFQPAITLWHRALSPVSTAKYGGCMRGKKQKLYGRGKFRHGE